MRGRAGVGGEKDGERVGLRERGSVFFFAPPFLSLLFSLLAFPLGVFLLYPLSQSARLNKQKLVPVFAKRTKEDPPVKSKEKSQRVKRALLLSLRPFSPIAFYFFY